MFKFKYWIFLFISHSLCALTTLHVTVSSDNNPGGIGEVGDLRYCLNTMNVGLNTTPDDYAIVFDFSMTIQLNGILPLINNSSNSVNISIGNADPTSIVTIDGNSPYGGPYPGFFIANGNVIIQNMIFQNLIAQGGNGGDGISGGGGGMGAGGAIYVPESFFMNPNPSVTLINVSINDCSAVGGNGGNYLGIYSSPTGNEGGGGGGGFGGNGGSIITTGSTGGAGGGGFGGDGGNVTLSTNDSLGGGGGGGGGLGSRATIGYLANLGNGGSDQESGLDGNGYGIVMSGGAGAGGYAGGNNLGGGGGGDELSAPAGGGGGGSSGFPGMPAQGAMAPGGSVVPSGGNGTAGGGGGGGGVVATGMTPSNPPDGAAGSGDYAAGGGGGAGTGAFDVGFTVEGGSGGTGGGGGGGGVDQSGTTLATGGNSIGGGGGGGGPSNGSSASGGTETDHLGGGSGGAGADSVGSSSGGGGGGGGSGLGGAIFVDSGLNFTIQALSGIPTTFNTSNNTTQAGTGGSAGSGGGSDGSDGSALGNSIFLRSGTSLSLVANDAGDLLTLGDQVAFVDDNSFGAGGTVVVVSGNGTVVYNGTSDYQGTVSINNANFKVNGQINEASISVCRNINFGSQRGTLSGTGILTGDVFVNSGTISPDTGGTLTLGSLSLSPADPIGGALGSLVHIEIGYSGTSLVSVTGAASLAGTLEIDLDPSVQPGTYTILTSYGIADTFDSVTFTGATPNYSLSYLPIGSPTFVRFDFLGYPPPTPSISAPLNLTGSQKQNIFLLTRYLVNVLNWQAPSDDAGIVSYNVYRDVNLTELAASVPATAPLTYLDYNRLPGISYTYYVVSLDESGNMSLPASVTIP